MIEKRMRHAERLADFTVGHEEDLEVTHNVPRGKP